ncbi:hypothetical protein AOQ84DRAFT_106531 [Glonium stellatum]|uniref:Myb-like domain-containing protein n=1 Tax=Glonium stellatum TaxID=574774 RepID=A0A8E2EV99_9PEZI|nr:hypothetical protein AOQ84DRAFT_106531 [Glonium stellatum]
MEGYFNYQLLWQCDLLSSVSTRSAPTTSPSSASSSSASTISINSPHQTIQKPHPLLAANRKPFTHRPANDRANWTVGDRLQLINVTFEGGDGWDRVASNLKRSVRACQNKYYQIFLAAGARKEWTDEEYSIACYLRSLGCQYVHIARWVPHSPAHIRELDIKKPGILDLRLIEVWQLSPIVVANETLQNPTAPKKQDKWPEKDKALLLTLREKKKPWKEIAKHFPHKTPWQCEHQYNSLRPKAVEQWTADEETLLTSLREGGMEWRDISRWLPGRTRQLCAQHYVDMFPHKATKWKQAAPHGQD